ncbi:6,7-dimethyl-8-ribityllumazine synthase [Hydrocarboniphaga effusa]|uniref:6,7-dimethyl-8-ribityllumazine synthase n=1 Tax=Hydrocarboniphaga effusa AP103 TaxID=1172194 RepID=I8TCP4_9GAMM|nr:6,7-dimethyl-8-ribityllumazine synthase [Hydrocarboniphaga effusa AP103]
MNQALKPLFPIAADRAELPRVAFVQACWHREIVDRCRDGFGAELQRLGFAADQIDYYEVPGAYELPLQTRLLAKSGRYAAIVAAGLVVDGGIYRHDFVAQAVIDGLMRNQLDLEVPMLSAVLTPHHFHEHEEHRRYFGEHFVVKGTEAARACAATLEATRKALALA